MKSLLFITPTPNCATKIKLTTGLQNAGFRIVCVSLNGTSGEASCTLQDAFGGRAPDVLLVDLSDTSTYLPLHYIRRILHNNWGSDLSPLCLTLLATDHLTNPESPAMADDFVLPPYSAREIVARLNQLLFRRRHLSVADTMTLADLSLDVSSRQARDTNNSNLVLTPREYDLLEFLLKHRGKLFARDRLLDLVWGIDFEGGERTVDVHIRRLRAKLPPDAAMLLETRRGFGYGFRMP